MPREALAAGTSDPGAKDGRLASHRWLGGNTLIPAYYQYPEQAEKVAAFLKNSYDGKGVLNVDIFGLEKKNAADPDRTLVAPLGLTNFSIAAGETLTADVVIQNKGVGHVLIPTRSSPVTTGTDCE
jgi:hypothetical protein